MKFKVRLMLKKSPKTSLEILRADKISSRHISKNKTAPKIPIQCLSKSITKIDQIVPKI